MPESKPHASPAIDDLLAVMARLRDPDGGCPWDIEHYNWRKRFGGMGRSQLSEMRSLEKENTR